MRRIVLLLLCIVPFAAHAEDRSKTEDGTFWNQLTQEEKLFYIEGYTAGWVNGATEGQLHLGATGSDVAHLNHNPGAITFGTLMDGVDKCFSDFRNSKLDVAFCVDWAVLGIKGYSDQSREQYLVRARKVVSD